MKIKIFGHPLSPRAHGTFPRSKSAKLPSRCTDRELCRTKWHPSYTCFTFQVNRQKKTLFEKQWSDGEEITTRKTGTTFCIRSGHKINWFLAFEALSVFLVVIFRHISRDKGQKARRHVVPKGSPGQGCARGCARVVCNEFGGCARGVQKGFLFGPDKYHENKSF